MKPGTKTKIYAGGAILIVCILAIALQSGWKPTGSISFGSKQISIEVAYPGSVIFLDGKEKEVSTSARENITLKGISSGDHEIIVAKENFWPWAKSVRLGNEATPVLKSFHVPQRIEVTDVTAQSSEWVPAWTKFATLSLPTEENPLLSLDSSVALWAENNKIFIGWRGTVEDRPAFFCPQEACESRLQVFEGLSNIISLGFFNNRNDVVVFSNEDGVFAIEADKREPQNFQPIFRTASPSFYATPEGLYVKNASGIRFVPLPQESL